ncbi:MAG: hypothetical protein IPM54_04580 [Polyangiaceae bacterium]|nr:hypothetical protein [Polyangiaceae bacterium]
MHEPPSEGWKPFGSHTHRFEPPDVYFTRVNGNVTGDDMRTQVEAIRALSQRAGRPMFWLVDVSKMGTVSAEARQLAAAASKGEEQPILGGSFIFGASFTTRVVVGMLLRAVRLIKPAKQRPTVFVETEAQARAFLDEHRKRGMDKSPP